MDKVIIIDSDMASAFAKIGRLGLLKQLLSRHSIFITPRIYEELAVPLDYGYTFPKDIFNAFDVLYPSEEENNEYQELLTENRGLGRGELEAICVCKSRGYVFSSIDSVALNLARAEGVETFEH